MAALAGPASWMVLPLLLVLAVWGLAVPNGVYIVEVAAKLDDGSQTRAVTQVIPETLSYLTTRTGASALA